MIAVAIAVPTSAASVGTGFLYLIGNAIREEYFALALNYDSAGATRAYAPGELGVTVALPDVPGVVDEFYPDRPSAFAAVREGQLITMVNLYDIPAGSGQHGGNILVRGPFPSGASYTITLRPSNINFAPVGNLSLDGQFIPPRGGF